MTSTTLQTLRIPRGLWADLEASVIQQDRQFLTEVARNLGLPVAEVLRKCLGTGTSTQVQVLIGAHSEEDLDRCPWWDRRCNQLWHPCTRLRLTPDLPCQVHKRLHADPNTCLGSDSRLSTLPIVYPVSYEGELYWVSTDGDLIFREDSTLETGVVFKRITDTDGQRKWFVLKPNPSSTQ